MSDRYCLIGVDNTILDNNFTGDPAAIEEGQRVIVGPINFGEDGAPTWDPETGSWIIAQAIGTADTNPNVTCGMEIMAMMDGLVAKGIFTAADRTRIIETGAWG